jgi:arylformamidase
VTAIYRDLDQATLDFQYNNQAQVPDPKRYLDWYGPASEAVRARVAHISDVPYGPLPDQRLDIFRPQDAADNDQRPVVVFVHGGAWRNLDRAGSSFPAETFTAHGALYVAVGFTRMPQAGSLDEMVAQVRAALAWLWLNIEQYGGDRTRLHLIGHSSGAHLSAMTLGTDWRRQFGLPTTLLRSAALISGIYDLEPVRLSFRNDMLKLDRAAELRNSPCRNLPDSGIPLLVGFGEFDTAEFKRQATEFSGLWQRCYGNARLVAFPGLNHYEIIETITDPGSLLSREVLDWFGL